MEAKIYQTGQGDKDKKFGYLILPSRVALQIFAYMASQILLLEGANAVRSEPDQYEQVE
jgi:hypothetical protein